MAHPWGLGKNRGVCMPRNAVLSFVNTDILGCRNCELHENGMAIPFVGSDPKCILIGEAPGRNEIEKGEPFVGKAGKLLMETFASQGFTRDNFIILNSTNCRPIIVKDGKFKNGKPNIEQIAACKPNNEAYIKASGLKFIMTLGSYAASLYSGTTLAISNYVGSRIHDSNGGLVFINFHPAATIYDRSKRQVFTDNIAIFCQHIRENERI